MLQQCCVKCGTDVDEINLFSIGGCILTEKNEKCEIKVYLCSGCRDEFWNDFIGEKPI